MIYTPRESIDLITGLFDRGCLSNPSTCTKIEFKGFKISIAMDASHGPGDLGRTDIRVYSPAGADVSDLFAEGGESMIYGNAESLLRVMKAIEKM